MVQWFQFQNLDLPVINIVAIPVIDSNSPPMVIPYPTKLICVPIPNKLLVPDAAPVEMPILGLLSKVNVAIPALELNIGYCNTSTHNINLSSKSNIVTSTRNT